MKQKKLSKEQKEKRQHLLKVTKNVVFYISLALNVLVVIAFAISGCSPKSNVQSIDRVDLGESIQLRKQKANASFNGGNLNCVGYDLTYPQYKGGISYVGSFTTTLSNAYTLGTPTTTSLAPVNTMTFNVNINDVPVYGNHISYSVNGNENVRTYTYNGSWWAITGYNVIENIFINNQMSVTNDTFIFYDILEQFFDKVESFDYDLSNNWYPLVYFYERGYNVTSNPQHYVNILDNALFSINGQYFDYLKITFIDYNGGSLNVIDRNGDVKEVHAQSGEYISFIYSIYAYNSKTENELYIWHTPYVKPGQQSGIDVPQIKPFDGYFVDKVFSQVRLFDYNLTESVQGSYINGNVLNAQYNYFGGFGGSGQFGDVFGLITNAFSGLTGLFAIQILPGLTIGILLFVPLIALIVFALVRIIKK